MAPDVEDRTQVHGSPRDDILFGGRTDVGVERDDNQDAMGFYEPDEGDLFRVQGRLAIVCDGMGGHKGGRTASGLAIRTVIETYRESTAPDRAAVLREAIHRANRTVFEKARSEPDLHGMGTTCVAVAIRDGLGMIGHVGDSRCYLLRNGRLDQATRDHSLVQEMVDRGLIAPDQAENHPEKNVILRSLGVKPEVEVDILYLPLEADDLLLLCSDGLCGLVTDEEIQEILEAEREDLDRACDALVDRAREAGGHDNITAELVEVRELPAVTGGAAARLHVLGGDRAGEVISLFANGPRLLGSRRSADISLADDGVSWNHARIHAEKGTFYIEDAGSDDGTFVNDTQVRSRLPLSHGDLLRLGETELVFSTHR